jgi:hypothetical protein
MIPRDVSVAIPPLQPESVLLDTLNALVESGAGEVLVVDQTPSHEPITDARLHELDEGSPIRWIQLKQPSIPHAMNVPPGFLGELRALLLAMRLPFRGPRYVTFER